MIKIEDFVYQVIYLLALSICNFIDSSVFRYVHTMMDLIDSVDWMKTEDFRYFVQIVYPFLDVSFS